MANYAFCESPKATSREAWHIRPLTPAGKKLGGGIDTRSLWSSRAITRQRLGPRSGGRRLPALRNNRRSTARLQDVRGRVSKQRRWAVKVWISKYALTQGVLEKDAEVDETMQMATVRGDDYTGYYHRGEWHRSPMSAALKASNMRDAKIKSLKKQLAKLEAMTFQS